MQKLDLGFDDCALKFASKDLGRFEGYLSVFGNVDSYGDTVFKGAYEDTLTSRKRMPPMLLNHDAYAVPIGVWKSMAEDDHGLRVVGEFTKGNPISDQVLAAVKHGAMSGLSIGYRAVDSKENKSGGVDLYKIDLREGSVVTMPAEDDARIDIVKYEDIFGEIESFKDFELSLREVGCSRVMAKKMVSQFKEVCQRDVDELRQKLDQRESELAAIIATQHRAARLSKLESLIR